MTGSTLCVLLTGFSEGIGGATARMLAKQARDAGQTLKIVGTASGTKPEPSGLISDLEALGAQVLYLTGDLADVDVAQNLGQQALEFCGGMDVFVSNAGGVSPGRLTDLPIEKWERQFDLNTRATLVLAQVLYPALKASGGALVAVASMSGMFAHLGQAAYSPAKAALISMVRNLAQEWAPDGIRVNAVAPGMIETPLTAGVYAHDTVKAARAAMVPLGRIGLPDDIAEVVVFLAKAKYVTGQTLLADGGLCDSLLGTIPGLPKT